ncbi:MAG: XrtA/PEP-CTERM system TPR-repeat protein PrsT [Geminicoccaceae bacterium]
MQQAPSEPEPIPSSGRAGHRGWTVRLRQAICFRRVVRLGFVASLLTLGLILPLSAGYLEDAREDIANDDLRTAIIHLRNALKDAPDNVQARSLLGELLLEQGKVTAARDHLNRAFETTPDADIATLLGYALLAEGEAETALHFAERNKIQFRENVRRLPLLEAEALLSLERPDEAAAALAPYLRDKPLDADALVINSRLKIATGDLAGATASIARALEVDASSLQALWTKVDVDAAAGRFDLAHIDVDRLAEQAPGNPQIEVARASIFISAGRLNEARKRLETVLTDNPDMPSASLLLAMIMAAEGDYVGTQRQLDRLDKRAKSSKTYLLLSGLANAVEHRYATAETLLSDYVEQSPGNHTARRLLGNVQLNAGLDSSAITTLAPLAAEQPPNMPALQLLASAQIRAGRLDDAEATLRRLDEDGPPATAEQARALLAILENDDFGKERHDVARALNHIHYGDSEKALSILDDLTAEQPKNTTFLNLLGITRFRAGDEAGARAAFNVILDIDPEHDEATQSLDQLDFRAGNIEALEERLEQRLHKGKGQARERAALDLATLIAGKAGDKAAYDFLAEEAVAQPTSIGLREALITQAAALGRPVAKEPWLDQLMTLGNDGARDAYRIAGVLAGRYGKPELAAEAFTRLASASPDDPEPQIALARAHYVLGRPEEVRASALVALAIDPAHELGNRILVELAIETGDEGQARRHIENLEAHAPALGRELLARGHSRNGREDEAFDILKIALSAFRDPGLAHALFIHRRQAGRYDEAIEGLRSWLVREPSDAVAMDLLGDVYVEQGELGLALRYYEQATSMSGDNPILLNDLSWVRHVLGLPEAAEAAKRAYIMAPLPEIADTLGWILTRDGELDSGLPLLREALSARPDNPTIRYHLAFALAEDEQLDEAEATLETLVDEQRPFAEREDALALWERLKASRQAVAGAQNQP